MAGLPYQLPWRRFACVLHRLGYRHPSFVARQGSRTVREELDALISQMHKGGILYVEAVREFRKAFIATVLRENNGNQSKAARELGMHRNTLSRTVATLEVDVRALRPGSRRPPGRERLVPVTSRVSR